MGEPQLTTFIGANRVRVETQQHTLPLMGVGRGFFVSSLSEKRYTNHTNNLKR
jgi:hypothetical protein